MGKPRIFIFASGTKTGGGSGAEKLVFASRQGILDADIVAIASNYEYGGVRTRADALKVPFVYFPGPFTQEGYKDVIAPFRPDFTALSGWLKKVKGLSPKKTINIHPGPLPEFGGPGMYGHHVHQAVFEAYRAGKITHSAVSMHFVTEEYDKGPVFFHMPVGISPNDTPDDIARNVNCQEHIWQPVITNLVVQGHITWDGVNPSSLRVSNGYRFL